MKTTEINAKKLFDVLFDVHDKMNIHDKMHIQKLREIFLDFASKNQEYNSMFNSFYAGVMAGIFLIRNGLIKGEK
jgi:hypothetical protein